MPSKEQLIPYIKNIKEGAKKFNKSTRTIRRWLLHYELYSPEIKYKPGKTTKEMVANIKKLDKKNLTQSKIAKIVGISQTMVGRIINKGLMLSGSSAARVTFQ